MSRRILNVLLAGLAAAALLRWVATAVAAPAAWSKIPSVTVVSRESGDPRIAAARQAVDFWNGTFAELGTRFRLGEVTLVTGSAPDQDLQLVSEQILHHGSASRLPASLTRFPGDLVIILSGAHFVSFTARSQGRVLIAIKDGNAPPLTLPNVPRNVIAHELGHAIGLEHNADPSLLMCGRPAPCRPDAFQSETDRFFPLSDADRARVLTLYPKQWPR